MPARDRGPLGGIVERLRPRRAVAPPARFVFLLAADGTEIARAVEDALRAASIPFESGLQAYPEPRIVFSVPENRREEAKEVVEQCFGAGPLASSDGPAEERREPPVRFPREALGVSAALVAVHLAVLAFVVGADADASRLASAGGLVSGEGVPSFWRLLSYPFVHADLSHALWNGLALVVFAVPVFERLGWARTAAVYWSGAIAGGMAALGTSAAGTVTVGSSAAVAALFGAWVVLAVRDAARAPLSRRAAVRAVGIGLLVLPTLVAPTTSGGRRVSVAAHLGGLAAGTLLGLAIREERRESPGLTAPATSTVPGDGPRPGPTSRE